MTELLPVDLHGELELARIIGGSRLSGVGEERTDGSYVVFVGDIEHVGDQVHAEALGEVDSLRHTHVAKGGPRRQTCVAAEVAVELQQRRDFSSGNESIDTDFLKSSARRELRR